MKEARQGTLVREVPMRLMDVSLSGCLVESDQPLGVGTSGTLHVDLWGVPCRYPVRVTRVTMRPETSHGVRIAGEFAWRETPDRSGAGRLVEVLALDRSSGC